MNRQADIQLALHDNCTGCAACASICPTKSITMCEDREGFLQPHIDADSCIKCHKCEKTCPIIATKTTQNYEPKVYAAINKDIDIRKRSSSGGMFYPLAKWTIEQGGVVFGAAFDGIHLKHQYTEVLDDVRKFMGSKYVQSDVANAYKEVEDFLNIDRWVLYTGTPCQIAGLKRYLRKDYDKLLTVDLICYGVPSPTIWEKYITRKLSQLKAKEVHNITFRHNINYRLTFDYLDNDNKWQKFDEDNIKNAYYAFFMRLLFRSSCYQCQFRSIDASYADFTIGDCWNANEEHPELADGVGVSILISHTKKAYDVLNLVKQTLILVEEDVSTMVKRYKDAKYREQSNNKTRQWRLSNRLAQFVPLEKMRFVYMHDRIGIIVKRKITKIFDKIKRHV